MAERDRLGKQAVTSKGAAGLYRKNKQSLTTHSTVMAERDRSGKQAVRQILRLYRNDEEDACLVGHGKG